MTYEEVLKEEASYCAWAKRAAAEEKTRARMARLVRWINQMEGAPPIRAVHPPQAKSSITVKVETPQENPIHDQMLENQQMMIQQITRLTNAMGSLQEDVEQMKEERPRKPSKTMTNS